MKQSYSSNNKYSIDKNIALFFYINNQPSENALQIYNSWLEDQFGYKDDIILEMLHISVHYGWDNTIKTILSSEAGCIAILSDDSLQVKVKNTGNPNIVNALNHYQQAMSSLPTEDSTLEDKTEGIIVNAFKDPSGNLHPGGGPSSSTWKEIQAFQTRSGDLMELTPYLTEQILNDPISKKRSAGELEDPTPCKQIKLEGISEFIFLDEEGLFNIDENASLEEIILAQEFLINQLELANSFTPIPSFETNLDPLYMLTGAEFS